MARCKDCWAEGRPLTRPAPHEGPRCATHWRDELKRRKQTAHDKRVQGVYGLGPGDYDRLYALQGGVCAICRKATGATKRLAVDHDHRSGEVRGLLCSVCNRLLGHARDNLNFFVRAITYLTNPPARELKRNG